MRKSHQSPRRWRTIAVLAIGVAIGTTLTATPVYSHVGGTVAHLWTKHIRPKADVRYANAVPGTDKAKDADELDGRDLNEFASAFDYQCGPGQFLRTVEESFSSAGFLCAGDATTATTATNAGSVDGQSATTFNHNVLGGSGSAVWTRLFSLGGLTVDAWCKAESGDDLLFIRAFTDMDNSYIRSDIVGAPADSDWDMAEGSPAGGTNWFASNEDKAGTFVYRRGGSAAVDGQVTSVALAWDTDGLGCDLVGTVIGH